MNAIPVHKPADDNQAGLAESVSAFMDGETPCPQALLRDPQAREHWDNYHLIGDILRAPGLARAPSRDFQSRMAAALADEPAIVAAPAPVPATPVRRATRYAVPGLALAAAVAAVTWVVQPYIVPSMQGNTEALVASATPVEPEFSLVDYLDAHRHMAGVSGVRQVAFEAGQP